MRVTIAIEPLKILKNVTLLGYLNTAKHVFFMDEQSLDTARATKTKAIVHVLAAEHSLDYKVESGNLYILI